MCPNMKKARTILCLALTLVVFGFLGHRVLSGPRATVLGWNQPLRLDDFVFQVTSARRVPGAPSGSQRWVVSLRVDNHAKRVSYQFRREMVEVIDAQGRTFTLSRPGQKALDNARKGPDPLALPLLAGKGATTELVFDLPTDSRDPCLRLTFGKLGDALDGFLGGRTQFRLDPEADPLADRE